MCHTGFNSHAAIPFTCYQHSQASHTSQHRFSSFSRHRGDIHSRRPYSDSRLEVLFLGRKPGSNGAVPLNTIIGEIKRSQPQLRVALGLSPLGPKKLSLPSHKVLCRSFGAILSVAFQTFVCHMWTGTFKFYEAVPYLPFSLQHSFDKTVSHDRGQLRSAST